ncbi:MAG: DMT family transporter [Burkholderiales bacterium]|nr:DMT family transporter [Phycisphaerae bacterium]
MPQAYLGEIYAGVAACCWVISATCFEAAGKRIGSLVVNLLRLLIAVALLGIICWIRRGTFLPVDAPPHVLWWIIVSGVIGFFLCDMCLFRALVLAGARRCMLMLSLAPCFAAVLDVASGEPPTARMWLGMAITLAGVMWAITQRSAEHETPHSRRELRIGVLLALSAALLQALGAKAAEIGLDLGNGNHYDAMAATFIRASAGAVCFALLIAATGRAASVLAGSRHPQTMLILTLGAIAGPVIGVTLFLASLARVQSSVTQTILATMPILALPVAYFFNKERISAQAIAGTILCVIGVMILCLR